MARTRRGLSPEDRAVWRQVADTTTPMPGRTSPNPAPKPATVSAAKSVPVEVPRRAEIAPAPRRVPDHAQPLMDQRRFEKMRRGRLEPEARLDLHGMTAERAHAALVRFILSAQERGIRLVLVITGKGRPRPDDGPYGAPTGILRHGVPHWLAAPPLTGRVLQTAPAHFRHGGAGALYVYLRRAR